MLTTAHDSVTLTEGISENVRMVFSGRTVGIKKCQYLSLSLCVYLCKATVFNQMPLLLSVSSKMKLILRKLRVQGTSVHNLE